ncbi:MAG: hypothetical protein OD817_02965 [Gammaproteobacteria bacterium]
MPPQHAAGYAPAGREGHADPARAAAYAVFAVFAGLACVTPGWALFRDDGRNAYTAHAAVEKK